MKSMRVLQQGALRQLFSAQSRTRLSQLAFRQIRHTSRSTFRTRPLKPSASSLHSPSSTLRSRINLSNAFRPFRRHQSTQAGASDTNLSLSQRLRKLSREYGWSALGVYLALTALDFPFCFLAVNQLGADRIGHWEHVVLSYIKSWVKWPLSQGGQDMVDGAVSEVKRVVEEKVPVEELRKDGQKRILEEEQTMVVDDHGYKEAEKANRGENASLWTQLALAYAIHKSFIFVRVPLTAAVTPKVVNTLRSWGWDIGKRPAKKIASRTGVNTGKTGVKSDK